MVGALPSLAPARTGWVYDFCYSNPFPGRFISESEANVLFREMDRRVSGGHLVGWDVEVPEFRGVKC